MSVQSPSQPYSYTQPAQETSLGMQGHAMLPRIWTPTRGLVLRSSLPMLPADACTIAQNVRWNGLTWTTQNIGWVQQRSATFGNGAIVEQAVHYISSGQPLYVHQAGTMVQTYDPTQTATKETTLFTASGTSIPCMRSFSPNYFLYVNGINYPQYWSGNIEANAFTQLPSFPLSNGGVTYSAPSMVETFCNRACFAGFVNAPFAVVISNFGDPTTITIDSGTIVATHGGIYEVPSQLGPITSLKVLQVSLTSNEQVLLVGCQNGFAFISGLDATSFTMVTVQSGFWGIPSNRCWYVVDTNAYGLCTDGLRAFSGNAYLSNLASSSLTFPVHPLVTGWNSTTQYAGNEFQTLGTQAFCLNNPSQLESIFYFCSGGDIQNKTALILNYQDMASNLLRFSTKAFPNVQSGGTPYSPACGVCFKGQYFAGGFDGKLQVLYTTNTWNGMGINYSIGSPLLPAPTPMQEASIRGFWILSQGTTTSFNAQAYGWMPMAAGGLRRTLLLNKTCSYNTNGTAILGQCILGSATLGGSQYEITEFYPPGGARAFEFGMSGNTLNGDLNLVGVFGTLIGGGTSQ